MESGGKGENINFVMHRVMSFGHVSVRYSDGRFQIKSSSVPSELNDKVKIELMKLVVEAMILAKTMKIAHKFGAPNPKSFLEFLFDLFIPADEANDIRMNLHELMPVWEWRHGIRKARFIYNFSLFSVVWARGWDKIKSIVNIFSKFSKFS